MSDTATTVLVGAAGFIGVVVGWLVLGYQRVAESTMEERRAAYANLIGEADIARAVAERPELSLAVARADVVCSQFMREQKRIRHLVDSIKATEDGAWQRERADFVQLARLDSLGAVNLRRSGNEKRFIESRARTRDVT